MTAGGEANLPLKGCISAEADWGLEFENSISSRIEFERTEIEAATRRPSWRSWSPTQHGVSEAAAKRQLFASLPGSSAADATYGSPKKKKNNNKGEPVLPDSPDCGLPEWHPARDGTRT